MTTEEVIKEWSQHHAQRDEALFIAKLRHHGLTDNHIATVITTIDRTCNHCWDGLSRCQCWNDE